MRSNNLPRVVGLTGPARSGKDTAANLLADLGYERVAFADPLKELALKVDPVVDFSAGRRLSDVVRRIGWERAKDEYPEVRTTLQTLGQGVREVLGANTWIELARQRIDAKVRGGAGRVVITDVRYPNEVSLCHRVIRIEREGAGLPGAAGQHSSEQTGLVPAHTTVRNDGDLQDLYVALRKALAA